MKKLTLCLFLCLFSMKAAVCNDRKDNESETKPQHPNLYFCGDHEFSSFEIYKLWTDHHLRMKTVSAASEGRKAILKYGAKARYGMYIFAFTDTLSNTLKLEEVLKIQEEAK